MLITGKDIEFDTGIENHPATFWALDNSNAKQCFVLWYNIETYSASADWKIAK
jgi:hypothetical protein